MLLTQEFRRLQYPRFPESRDRANLLHMRRLVFICILFAAVLLAYWPGFSNGFVWDDTALVLRDPLIRSPWLLVEGLRHFLFIDATASDFYRPLQRVVYTLDYWVGGFSPWRFHFTSILVHAAAAAAFFEFGRRLLARCGGVGPKLAESLAAAAALVWAVHPIHSSAVVYVAGLADPLAALCGFSGLALLLANRRVAAGICLGAALFAKESGVFALLIGLGFAWRLANPAASEKKSPGDSKKAFLQFARTALPAVAMASLYLTLRFTAEHIAPPTPEPVPAVVRPVLALRAVAEYAGLLAAPVNLHMERDVSTRTGGEVQPVLAAARAREFQTLLGAALLAGAVFWFRRSRSVAARECLVSALVAYLPVSNLFALNATVAEHWVYVPSAFLLLACAAEAGASPIFQRSGSRLAFPIALSFLVLWTVALAVRTAYRCADWRDQERFFRATIQSGGDTARMFTNLASVELGRGDAAGAARDYRQALAKKPNQPFAMQGLCGALIHQHDWQEARLWVARCEAIPLVRGPALVDEAVLEYQQAGRDRVDLLREAAALQPHFWPLRKRYIEHLAERGDSLEARRELLAVLEAQPFRAESWQMLGELLSKSGNPQLTEHAFEEAARCDVHFQYPREANAGRLPRS